MFLFIVFSLIAVKGLHKILPFWRPESAELGNREDTQELGYSYLYSLSAYKTKENNLYLEDLLVLSSVQITYQFVLNVGM